MKDEMSEKKQQLEDMRKSKLHLDEAEALDAEIASIDALVDSIYPSKKWMMNVLVKGETTPRIFTSSWTIFKTVFDAYTSNIDDDVDILDPKDGYNFEFSKTGKGKYNTKYAARILVAPKPLAADDKGHYDEAKANLILKQCFALDKENAIPTEAECRTAYEKYNAGVMSGAIKLDVDTDHTRNVRKETPAPAEETPAEEPEPQPSQPAATTPQPPAPTAAAGSAASRLAARLAAANR